MAIIRCLVQPDPNNRLEAVITLDKFPDYSSFTYRSGKIGPTTLYWAEQGGIVSFMTDGKGGAFYQSLKLSDGSSHIIKGGWSSRSSIANYVFPHSIECVYIVGDRRERFSGCILISRLEEMLKGSPYKVLRDYTGTEIGYMIVEVESSVGDCY